jgi:tetratricopeptide (TPR) repeat protein
MTIVLSAALALLPVLASAAGEPAVKTAEGARNLTAAEYHAGLKTLRGYLLKRGLDAEAAERFVAVMGASLPAAPGQRVDVTRDVFEAFLRYEAAWARKTRDGKNSNVSAALRAEEVARAGALKEKFRLEALVTSPVFYRVFQAAVRDVRLAPRRDGKGWAGNSAVFFGDQVDDSYTHVDAGDVALENGDEAAAIAEADKALAINPGNADAFVLRAGAKYEARDLVGASMDAQSALVLDPGNQQAREIVSLSGAGSSRLPALSSTAEGLAGDGRRGSLPTLGAPVGESTPVPSAARSATPAVAAMLSNELTSRAVETGRADARSSIGQLDRALLLNPRNASARGWRSAILNRIGDYSTALSAANQTLTESPEDASAWFNKAYALSGTGDRAGALDALARAARIDPAYQTVVDKALQLPKPEDFSLLFGEWADSHEPAAPPRSRQDRFPWTLVALGAVGGALALGGVAQLFRRGR